MSLCGAFPTILNGKLSGNNLTVEYSCEPGFYMTGNKTISCTNVTGSWVWDSGLPQCNVIDPRDQIHIYDDDDYTFPKTWFLILAGLMAALVFCCLLGLLLYFCCRYCGGTLCPYDKYGGAASGGAGGRCVCCGCCRRQQRHHDVSMSDDGGYYVMQAPPTDTHVPQTDRSTDRSGRSKKGVSRIAVMPSPPQTYSYNMYSPRSDSEHGHGHGHYCNHSHNPKPLRPAKEIHAWMPHSKPIRADHNTSTK